MADPKYYRGERNYDTFQWWKPGDWFGLHDEETNWSVGHNAIDVKEKNRIARIKASERQSQLDSDYRAELDNKRLHSELPGMLRSQLEFSKRQQEQTERRQSALDAENRQDRSDSRRRLAEAEGRERRRQILADRERNIGVDFLGDIMSRREGLISGVKDTPSIAMEGSRMAYDKMAQNMAASAGLSGSGRGFGRTAEQAYSSNLKTADANLINATSQSVLAEKTQRDSILNSLLGQQAQTATAKAGLATGEGNQIAPYLADRSTTFGQGLGLSQFGQGILGQVLGGINSNRSQNLAEQKNKFQEQNYWTNNLLNSFTNLAGAGIGLIGGGGG